MVPGSVGSIGTVSTVASRETLLSKFNAGIEKSNFLATHAPSLDDASSARTKAVPATVVATIETAKIEPAKGCHIFSLFICFLVPAR